MKNIIEVTTFNVTITDTALVGGGSYPLPGEISLAYNGVLFRMNYQNSGGTNKTIRQRVMSARRIQQNRFKDLRKIYGNAQIPPNQLHEICKTDRSGMSLLKNAMEKLDLSSRAYDRILKISRTIADLEGSEIIQAYHLAKAINYRNLDRNSWVR